MSRVEAIVVAASLAVFLFFAAAWIHLPGPQNDELLDLPVVLPHAHLPVALALGRRKLPIMLFSYVGALRGWLFRLWFLVIPMGVAGHRAFGIVLGLATLWLAYRFVLRFYGRPVALLTTALFSTDPSFIHTMRLDWGLVSLMHLFKMGGLCLLGRWVHSQSRAALAGGMFLFGLGLWDKANFIWFLAGLGATLVLLFPREMLERLRADRAALPIAAAALLVGAAPLVYYNLARTGQTWREHGQLEFRWSKLHQSKGTFEGDFMLLLTGGDQLDSSPAAHDVVFPRLADWMYRMGRSRQTILLPLFGLGLLALPLNLWLAPRGHPRRRLLFPLLLSVLTYASMFVSFDGGASVHHVTILLPFPLLFLAESLWTPAERWPRWSFAAVAVVIAAVAVNVSLNARHLAVYTRTGGTGGFTDAVYRLVPYLAENPGRKLYAIDWGFSGPIQFVGARWKLNVDDFFFALNTPPGTDHAEAVKKLGELMRGPRNLFLLHSPKRTFYPIPAREFFALAGSGIEMRRVAVFRERSGEITYEIYQQSGAPLVR